MSFSVSAIFSAIDQYNSQDPNQINFNGGSYPKELLYGQRMTEWLEKLNPNASDVLHIAARGQHIGRWNIARTSYDNNRVGYLKWRNVLKQFHADTLETILKEHAVDHATLEKVKDLVLKKGLKTNPEMQMLEDVICLVFLSHYYNDFIASHEDEKIIGILQKTWKKMSDNGKEFAMQISFSERGRHLIQEALG